MRKKLKNNFKNTPEVIDVKNINGNRVEVYSNCLIQVYDGILIQKTNKFQFKHLFG